MHKSVLGELRCGTRKISFYLFPFLILLYLISSRPHCILPTYSHESQLWNMQNALIIVSSDQIL